MTLHRNGTLFRRLKRMGVSLPSPPQEAWRDEHRSVILLSVASALPRFMEKQVFAGGWDAHKGASLRTYFVNSCFYAFAHEYRRFFRTEGSARETSLSMYELDDLVKNATAASSASDPETRVLDRMEVEGLLKKIAASTEDRAIVFLVAQGLTNLEIANELKVSESTVSRRLHRIRLGANRGTDRRLVERETPWDDYPNDAVGEALKRTRAYLRSWGILDLQAVPDLLVCLEGCRADYEKPDLPGLYRPSRDWQRNRLDLILDGPDIPVGDSARKTWNENGARVWREVYAELQRVHPGLRRPGRLNAPGAQKDLRRLYESLKIVEVWLRTTPLRSADSIG